MATNGLTSEGVTLWRGDGAQPTEGFNKVGEVLSFDGPGGAGSIIDMTHLESVAREKRAGLPDEGQLSLQLNLVPSDTEQRGLIQDRIDRVLRNFELRLTDAAPTTLKLSALVQEFSISGAVDDKIAANCVLEISDQVTWVF